MNARDVFLRHTDTAGKAYVQQHRCWDAEKFIQTQQAEAERLNAEALKKDAPARAKVEQITQATYQEARASN